MMMMMMMIRCIDVIEVII